MNIVIIGGSHIVLIGSTSGIRRDRGGTFTETRKKSSEEDRSLLETSDLGKVIALTFRLSPQAVLEEVNIRPLQGDTYYAVDGLPFFFPRKLIEC